MNGYLKDAIFSNLCPRGLLSGQDSGREGKASDMLMFSLVSVIHKESCFLTLSASHLPCHSFENRNTSHSWRKVDFLLSQE